MRLEIRAIIIVLLHNEYDKNILQFLLRLEGEGGKISSWTVYNSFSKALPYLKFNVSELLKTLNTFSEFSGCINSGIRKLARFRPDVGKELLSVLKEKPDENVASFIVAILVGISETDEFEKIFDETLELLQDENKNIVRYAIISLGRFNYENNQEQLEQGLRSIEPYLEDERPEIESAVANAYSTLFKFDSRVTDKIVQLSERENPQTQHEIANFLFNSLDKYREEDWYKKSLLNLTGYEDRVYTIDSILRQLIDIDNELISEYLAKWLESSNYNFRTENKITVVFQSTCIAMVDSENGFLDTLITKWLNTENEKYHIAVKHISELEGYNPKLDPEVLNTLSKSELKYIIMKIMAYHDEGEILCRLVFSILQVEGREGKIQGLVTSAFIDFIAYNYPGGSRKYLETKKKEGTEIEQLTANRILDWLNSYFEQLSALPKLTEFKPPPQRLKYYYFMRRKLDRELRESVDRSSPLLSMVHKVILKGGVRSFTKVNGQYTEKTPLAKISTTWEPPQGEFKNPVDQAYMRYIWRTIKKSDI